MTPAPSRAASHDSRESEPRGDGTTRWQQALQGAIREVAELLEVLEIDPATIDGVQPAVSEFPLQVPRSFVARMRRGDARDPLLLQVLPRQLERRVVPGFSADPLREATQAHGGVLRKYPGRALLVATAACPVHCRYCFRRHFPYGEHAAGRRHWRGALRSLCGQGDVTEIVLSGGDPLSLSDGRLKELVRDIEELESVDTLRIHTRFPIMLPERVGEALLEILTKTPLNTVLVVHCNHANEIDDAVRAGLRDLRSTGAQMLNQSVLLRGVNDDSDRLAALSRALFDAGVLPYYLHLLDPVAGAAHFDVDASRARELVGDLRRRLPGYLVPRLVREDPGELSKTTLV